MIPDWLIPLAGLLVGFGVLVASWPAGGPNPRGWVAAAVVLLGTIMFGAALIITLTDGV